MNGQAISYAFVFQGSMGDNLNEKVEEFANGLGLRTLFAKQSTEFLKIIVEPRCAE
jgi:hypothetical protein